MERREKGGGHPDKTVFVVPMREREREHKRFMSYRKSSHICGVASRLSRVVFMLWLLINSQFKFLCVCLYVLSIHVRVCLPLWDAHVSLCLQHLAMQFIMWSCVDEN